MGPEVSLALGPPALLAIMIWSTLQQVDSAVCIRRTRQTSNTSNIKNHNRTLLGTGESREISKITNSIPENGAGGIGGVLKSPLFGQQQVEYARLTAVLHKENSSKKGDKNG
jgi:hypothetical protein